MSQTPAPPLYRLVVFDELDDPPAVRDLVCRVTGRTRPTRCSGSPGRPASGRSRWTRRRSARLLDGLFELGVAAEAWRVDPFPDLSPPADDPRRRLPADGFRVKGLRGEPTHWVPWDKVELIAAGRIAAEDEFRDVAPPGWVSALLHRPGALPIGRPPRRRRSPRPCASRATRSARSSSSAATPGSPSGSSRTR